MSLIDLFKRKPTKIEIDTNPIMMTHSMRTLNELVEIHREYLKKLHLRQERKKRSKLYRKRKK